MRKLIVPTWLVALALCTSTTARAAMIEVPGMKSAQSGVNIFPAGSVLPGRLPCSLMRVTQLSSRMGPSETIRYRPAVVQLTTSRFRSIITFSVRENTRQLYSTTALSLTG